MTTGDGRFEKFYESAAILRCNGARDARAGVRAGTQLRAANCAREGGRGGKSEEGRERARWDATAAFIVVILFKILISPCYSRLRVGEGSFSSAFLVFLFTAGWCVLCARKVEDGFEGCKLAGVNMDVNSVGVNSAIYLN